jgi:DNA-binding IclR family transcriptional regulator
VRAARERTRDQRDIGRELPVHASALGKVLLAYLPVDELSEFLEGITLARYTPKTITSAAKLRKEVESVRRDGHAIADEELYPNVRSVAIPIFDALRTVPAAISLNGELASPTWADLPGLVEKMEQAARAISARLTRE